MSVVTTSQLKYTLTAAIMHARSGDMASAREKLRWLVKRQPYNVPAWLWLAFAAETPEEKRAALTRALLLKPDSPRVRAALLELFTPLHVERAARQGIFISYARPDEVIAVDLAADLRDAGFPVWIDVAEISEDSDWHTEVDAALQSCGLMLVVASPAAVDDEDVTAERIQFMRAGKILVPVLHQSCDLAQLELLHPPVDFRHDYGVGLHRLFGLLGGIARHAVS